MAGEAAQQPQQCSRITEQHGGSFLVSDRSLHNTTKGWSSKSEGQTVHAPTTVWSQATSQWQHACLLEEHCIPCGMFLHAQQLQAAVRVDWLCVKSTQLVVPALVSWHVAILVPVNIDLCRKREWDLTNDHFSLKSDYCEGLSVYHRWYEDLLLRNRTFHSPTHPSMTRIIDSSSRRRSLCVCVCMLLRGAVRRFTAIQCIVENSAWKRWQQGHTVP